MVSHAFDKLIIICRYIIFYTIYSMKTAAIFNTMLKTTGRTWILFWGFGLLCLGIHNWFPVCHTWLEIKDLLTEINAHRLFLFFCPADQVIGQTISSSLVWLSLCHYGLISWFTQDYWGNPSILHTLDLSLGLSCRINDYMHNLYNVYNNIFKFFSVIINTFALILPFANYSPTLLCEKL